MWHFLVSQLRHRKTRTLTLALGIVIAAVAFVLLAGSTRTSELKITGTLKRNYRNAYDILVRPRGSFTTLERRQGLVRPNYLSGIYGGISFAQYQKVLKTRGVQVAAPIANVGYVLLSGLVEVSAAPYYTDDPSQLYRVSFSWTSDNGLSHVPETSGYLYRASKAPPKDKQASICTGFNQSLPPITSPFDANSGAGFFACDFSGARYPKAVLYQFLFPVALAAIDPVQEAKLLHLNKTIVSGNYLSENAGFDLSTFKVPVIGASRTFVDDTLNASIERLKIPVGANVQAMLAAGSCRVPQVPCPAFSVTQPPVGSTAKNAYQWLTELPGTKVATKSYPSSAFYQRALNGQGIYTSIYLDSYWTVSPTSYDVVGTDHVRAKTVAPDPDALKDPFSPSVNGGFYPASRENDDLQFRKLNEISGINAAGATGHVPQVGVDIVGKFDPNKLPGFSPLSRVPLETYYPPLVAPASTASAAALKGKDLGPNQNMGGYIQQPPLLLTTMKALRTFQDPQIFAGVPQRIRNAPISAIRVRVAGVTGADKLSQLRIRTVAAEIQRETGLDVDVTAGSSPHPLTVTLPAGKYGRPALKLGEGWSKKGATVRYLNALDRKDLTLYALILIVCGVFLLNGALAVVRARRVEIGTLLTMGWSRASVFRAVIGELALVGGLAGAVGVVLAITLVEAFGLAMPITRTLLVLPIAVGLAVVAGLLPAWTAARGHPLDALRPPVRASRRTHRVRNLVQLAIVNLTRVPLRTGLGAAGLAIGVAALTVLIAIERSFQGTLVGTVLGSAVSLQVHSSDFVSVGLTLALAAISAADVLYLNLRERAAEFVTLSTLGWSERQIMLVVLLEAAMLALGAATLGAAVGIFVGGALVGVPYGALAIAAAVAGMAALAASVVASAVPTRQLLRLPAPAILAAE